MKIIAQTSGGFLIESNSEEIAQILGFYYSGSSGCPKIQTGLIIKVSDMFKRLEQIKYNSKRVKETRSKLREILLTLDNLETTLVEENLADKE